MDSNMANFPPEGQEADGTSVGNGNGNAADQSKALLPPSLNLRDMMMLQQTQSELGYKYIEAGNCAVIVSDSATIAHEIQKRTGTLASQYPDAKAFLEFYDASKVPQCRYARKIAQDEEGSDLQPLPWGQGQSVPQACQSGNQPAAWGPQGQAQIQEGQSGNQPASFGHSGFAPGWSAQPGAPPSVPQGQGQSANTTDNATVRDRLDSPTSITEHIRSFGKGPALAERVTYGDEMEQEDASTRVADSESQVSDSEHIRNFGKGPALAERVDYGDEMEEEGGASTRVWGRRGRRSTNLHRKVKIQRKEAPYPGKFPLPEDVQHRIELHEDEVFKNKRYDEDNICANCGHFGHWLCDCAFPDDAGSIKGCPLCNTKLHYWDQCVRAQALPSERRAELIVVRRANKPPIRSLDPFTTILQEALDTSDWKVFENLPGMPWTMRFTRNEIHKRFGDHAWINNEPFHVNKFPRDSESSDGTVDEIAQRQSLADEIHRPTVRRTKGRR